MVLCGDRHGSLDDNVIVITSTRGPDEILVREHFSGAGIYDIVADGQMIRQFGAGVVPHSVCIATRGATTGCGCTHEIGPRSRLFENVTPAGSTNVVAAGDWC